MINTPFFHVTSPTNRTNPLNHPNPANPNNPHPRCMHKAQIFPPDGMMPVWCHEKNDKPFFEIQCCSTDMCNKDIILSIPDEIVGERRSPKRPPKQTTHTTNPCRMCLSLTSPFPSTPNHLSTVMFQVGAGRSKGTLHRVTVNHMSLSSHLSMCITLLPPSILHVVVIARRRAIPTLTSTYDACRVHGRQSTAIWERTARNRSFKCVHHSFGYMHCRLQLRFEYFFSFRQLVQLNK